MYKPRSNTVATVAVSLNPSARSGLAANTFNASGHLNKTKSAVWGFSLSIKKIHNKHEWIKIKILTVDICIFRPLATTRLGRGACRNLFSAESYETACNTDKDYME